MTIDELLIKLGVDAKGVKTGMKQAEGTISSSVSSITSKLSALSAAVTAAFSIGAAFNQYVQEADAMGKLADAIEVNIEELHAWSETAARAGGSSEAFQASLQQLSGQLARTALTGSSRIKTVLDNAGIDAGELGRQRDAFDVLMDLAEKAETMDKSEFFGLGRSIGLDTGSIMMLQQGRTALKDAIVAQKEFGVYTKEDAKATADFNDRMADMGQAFRSFAAIIFRMVLPAVTAVIKWFNQFISTIRKHETFVKAFFVGIAAIITGLLIPALATLAATFLMNPLTWFVAALVALALVLEDLIGWANGADAAFGDLWTKIFGSPEEAKALWEEITSRFRSFYEAVVGYLPEMRTAWDVFQAGIELSFAPLVKLIETFRVLRAVWQVVSEAFASGLSSIKAAFEALSNVISNMFTAALEKAKSVWDSTLGGLSLPSFSLPSFSAADYLPGSTGNNMDNSTHQTNINATYNIESSDPQGVAREVAATQNNWVGQADVGVVG